MLENYQEYKSNNTKMSNQLPTQADLENGINNISSTLSQQLNRPINIDSQAVSRSIYDIMNMIQQDDQLRQSMERIGENLIPTINNITEQNQQNPQNDQINIEMRNLVSGIQQNAQLQQGIKSFIESIKNGIIEQNDQPDYQAN